MASELPAPESQNLNTLIKGSSERAIYKVLFENQDKSMSMADIRHALGLEAGQQEHLNRRMRELYRVFNVERTRNGTETLYRLISQREVQLNTENISNADRAWALRDKRCAQCGKTPEEDGVRLHVDHKIPQAWGGTNDRDNLQALCSQCNEGKKNLYATYDKYADKIKEAANYEEPHRRIGELLKAFNGEPVPSDLVEVVAKSKTYQDDWQKRMRELRELGWEYSFTKKREDNRVKSYFVLEHYEPWPEGSIRAAIKAQELRKKQS
jgi:5-methylcytosine-specific restriction endonuclease McrA